MVAQDSHRSKVEISALGVLLLLAVFWHFYFFDFSFLYEGPPDFSFNSLVSPLLISVIPAVFVYILHRDQVFFIPVVPSKTELFVDKWGAWITLVGCVFVAGVFVFDPYWFYRAAREDGIVEALSAILCLLSSIIFFVLFVKVCVVRSRSNLERFLILAACGISFLIGMEEISWFQRLLEVETPEMFASNMQQEFNIHNFATNLFENLYYFAAFFVFVFIPFFYERIWWIPHPTLTYFVPGIAPFTIAAISCSFNSDMWHGIPTQVAFWMCLFILINRIKSRQLYNISLLLRSCLVLMLILQTLFLARSNTFIRLWDVTEYKECLISLAMFIYAVVLFLRATGKEKLNPDEDGLSR